LISTGCALGLTPLNCAQSVVFLRGLINDAAGVGFSPARRVDALAIDSFMHGYHISGLRPQRGRRDGFEGP
jgi:hypothetical protein